MDGEGARRGERLLDLKGGQRPRAARRPRSPAPRAMRAHHAESEAGSGVIEGDTEVGRIIFAGAAWGALLAGEDGRKVERLLDFDSADNADTAGRTAGSHGPGRTDRAARRAAHAGPHTPGRTPGRTTGPHGRAALHATQARPESFTATADAQRGASSTTGPLCTRRRRVRSPLRQTADAPRGP
jgi:hypothetical protein